MTASPDSIMSLFALMYEYMHKSAYIRHNSKIQKYMLAGNARVFSRWFHSTMVRDTLLSPANILAAADKHIHQIGYTVPNVSVIPNHRHPYEMKFRTGAYSAGDHPIVNDIRVFLQRVSPVINLSENKTLPPSIVRNLVHELTVTDASYIEFIYITTIDMGLVEYEDGIHAVFLKQSNEATAFFNMPPRDAYLSVINSAARVCAEKLSVIIPGYTIAIEPSFVLSLLSKPYTTRDFFSNMYSILLDSFKKMISKGIDFEIVSPNFAEPMKLATMSEQDLYKIFITCTHVINSTYHIYFITVFGDYLNLINPFYEEILTLSELSSFITAGSERTEGYFVPPTHYALTPLAADILTLPGDSEEYAVFATKIPFGAILNAIPSANGTSNVTLSSLAAKYANPDCKHVYRIRITNEDDKSFWKVIDFSETDTLEQVHNVICCEFCMEPADHYSFNSDSSHSPFTSYTPASHKSKHKKTHKTRLSDVGLVEKSQLYYNLERNINPCLIRYPGITLSNIRYTLTVTGVRYQIGIECYPQVVRESDAAQYPGFPDNIYS